MYIPPSFRQSDEQQLIELIESHSFGLLVSQLEGQLFATHLPLLVERDAAGKVSLLGHVARANPQWRELPGQEVLAIFSGPHAYISPRWYEAEEVVPTWNYTAVHAYGRCEIIDDPEHAAAILVRYVQIYECPQAQPWSIDPQSPYFRKLLGAIVAFRVEVTRLEGKWKLNQNHPAERRIKAAEKLLELGGEQGTAIGTLMLEVD